MGLAQLRHAVDEMRCRGIYRISLTLITDEIDARCRKPEQIETYRRRDPVIAETTPGYHIEGSYLSPKPGFRGAHPAEKMKTPDLAEFRCLQRERPKAVSSAIEKLWEVKRLSITK